MIAPLKTMTITGAFGEPAVPGTGLPDSSDVKRHIGVDLRASVGTPVYSMEAGTVTIVDNVGLKLVEIRGTYTIRYLHLDRNILGVGQKVSAGQLVGYSGNTGGVAAHLHVDARKNGTAYNASYYNYVNPMSLITTKGGSEVFTTEAEVQQAYQMLRGKNASTAEVKGWLNQPQQRFFVVGKPEADGYRSQYASLERNFLIVRDERDKARAEKAALIVERDNLVKELAIMTADRDKLQVEVDASKEAYAQLQAEKEEAIAEINKVIEIKDNEIKRLNEELANCDGESLSWSQHLVLGIKGLLNALNPLSK